MPTPRLIIHGGAGAITPANLPDAQWQIYKAELTRIHAATNVRLNAGETALDAATEAVVMFEDCELWNCAKGAVFTREGTIELEASVMTSRGYHKRACGVVLIKQVKNPIKLAREMLMRGDTDGDGDRNGGDSGDPAGGAGGAQGHCCLGGETAERLAKDWGLEMVEEDYFWTKKRWDEHRRGLEDDNSYSMHPYLPQGTVGCVALDRHGTLCVATSTGGLTNKLPCRIGDTPTIGAGFWAEQWDDSPLETFPSLSISPLLTDLSQLIGTCLPYLRHYTAFEDDMEQLCINEKKEFSQNSSQTHAIALGGTGNGDYFLRLAVARTAGAIVRFSSPGLVPRRSLASAVNQIAGIGGEMQRAAGSRWGNGEGEGGMIGIEYRRGQAEVVWDFNCGGMFRCWQDERGFVRVGVFRDSEIVGKKA